MATKLMRQFQCELRGHQKPCNLVRGDPADTQPVPFHRGFEETTHSHLKIRGSHLLKPDNLNVTVFNPSKCVKHNFTVSPSDTIQKLKEEILKLNPGLDESMSLVLNGKPVYPHQTLEQLQVKPGAMFITYQVCIGG